MNKRNLKTGRFVRTLVDKKCPICNKIFRPWVKKTKVCSRKCWCKYVSITFRGKNSCHWIGNKIKYVGLHDRIRKTLGKPRKCEFCKTTKAKLYDWANKSRKYKTDLTDWIRLCRSCHIKYDRNLINLT